MNKKLRINKIEKGEYYVETFIRFEGWKVIAIFYDYTLARKFVSWHKDMI